MKVSVEQIEAELGNNGVLLRIKDNSGKSKGRLWVGKAKLRWYPGKTSKNYKEISMENFVKYLDTLP